MHGTIQSHHAAWRCIERRAQVAEARRAWPRSADLVDISGEGKCPCHAHLRARLEIPEVAEQLGSCRSFPGRGVSIV